MKAKQLYEIIPEIGELEISGTTQLNIAGISIDSREVGSGYVYAALRGNIVDGHRFIDQAILSGAVCVVCEEVAEKKKDVTYIISKDVRQVIGQMADLFYKKPSENLHLIGVTGTNGKTTVSTLLFQLFSAFGYKCGLISTVENRIGDEFLPSTHTTPDVINLHRLIAKMRDEQCEYVFMEVSSHSLEQQRIAGLKFKAGLFTNITHDHLDYHKTMKNYIKSKKKFFDMLPKSAFALTNGDDKNGLVMLQNTKARKLTYALKSMADYKGRIIESSVHGLNIKINNREAFFRLIGEFNAYNLVLVYGTAIELGMESDDVLAILSGLRGAAGRFEQIIETGDGRCGIVDYAHTPDALENVLETIMRVKTSESAIITVIGCGGDRDVTKRPIMAKVAAGLSDKVILTSDNPRSEDPERIIDDMEAGLSEEQKKKVLRVTNRLQAIKTAVMMSQGKDIILVAGKGHENYQEIKGEKFPFDDKKILKELLG
ncbi:MAG: UDP-N-acetylmuramoyl-L-alanyl-D-glutamate--2,6-diaminopimelate ligase [Saprospiraceae bacterium]|nr:UDP-N-acetylmuramoyl-L-alanyl-D-glutamate--2,6-diaminopimelate ligase [Saprospiraceae bacterium]